MDEDFFHNDNKQEDEFHGYSEMPAGDSSQPAANNTAA
jgi:hypothetical protein